jgi:hypothetical protein
VAESLASRRSTLLLIGGELILVAAVAGTFAPGLAGVLVVLMGVAAILGVDALRAAGARIPETARAYTVGSAAAISGGALFARAFGGLGVAWAGIPALVVVVAVIAARPAGRLATGAMTVLVLTQGALLWALVTTRHPPIDVLTFLTEGSRSLLHGANPYTAAYPNIYGPEQTALFYGPGVVGSDGMLTFGLPYPPAGLLPAVPAYLAGDVRLAPLVAVLGTALLLYIGSRGARRAAAVLLAVAPGLPLVVLNSWTEGAIVALFAVAVWLADRGRWVAAAALLGLAFASKQYFVVALPCLWLLRPHVTRARLAAMVGVVGAVTLPFVLWDVPAFWRSVVSFQLHQPLRADSVSLLTWSVRAFGWPGPAVFAVLPLTIGVLVAVVAARRLRPGVPSFLTATSLSLLVTTALSKQAFLNYYFLIGSLLILAAWSVAARPRHGPEVDGAQEADDARAAQATPRPALEPDLARS